jgi:hypothetical protein
VPGAPRRNSYAIKGPISGGRARIGWRTPVGRHSLGPHRGHSRPVNNQRNQRPRGPSAARERSGNDWRPRNGEFQGSSQRDSSSPLMVALWRNVGGCSSRRWIVHRCSGSSRALPRRCAAARWAALDHPRAPEELAAVEEPPRSEDGPGVGDLSERAVRGQALSVVVFAE